MSRPLTDEEQAEDAALASSGLEGLRPCPICSRLHNNIIRGYCLVQLAPEKGNLPAAVIETCAPCVQLYQLHCLGTAR